MARKKKEEEHENHERWLISYADFITLLFAFFVVMYSISAINEGKYRVLSDSLVVAFHSTAHTVDPIQVGEISKSSEQPGLIKAFVEQKNSPLNQEPRSLAPIVRGDYSTTPQMRLGTASGEQSAKDQADKVQSGGGDQSLREGMLAIKKMADDIEKALADLIKRDLIAVRRSDLWVEVEIKTSILFPSGSARLQAGALPILNEIARILKGFPNPIRVEGFTDSVPINTMAFPSNWELSAGRSASVVHLFTKEGVDPRRMASIGFGEYRPIADNSTPEGRNKNRRVVIVILEGGSAERIFGDKDNLTGHDVRAAGGGMAPESSPPKEGVPVRGGVDAKQGK